MEKLNTVSDSEKCPSCGSSLFFAADKGVLVCSFCGSTFDPEKIALTKLIELPDNAPEDDASDADEDKYQIVCNFCGAAVITDEHTISTFCAFCGSPSLVKARLTDKFRPEALIPFTVTAEEAADKVIAYAKTKKYTPSDFLKKENISKITGLYVPFWLIDAKCHSSARFTAYKYRKALRERHNVENELQFGVKDVPFDASPAIPDSLMEAIEPFDTSKLIPFSTLYLQGYYAQKFELTSEELSERILVRIGRYGEQLAKESLTGFSAHDLRGASAGVDELRQRYVLCPVWFLNYQYEGGTYSFAVNGQTGKTDGYMPVSKSKRMRALTAYWIVTSFIALLTVVIPLIALAFACYKIITSLLQSSVLIVVLLCMFSLILVGTYYVLMFAPKWNIPFSPNPILSKGLNKVYMNRRNKYYEILNETAVLVNDRPKAEEYIDTSVKSDLQTRDILEGTETILQHE